MKAEVRGLPREEPLFNIIWVHPSKKINLLKQIRNLMYVFTLDQTTPGSELIKEEFSQETLNKIKTDTSFYIHAIKDEYAKGQEVVFLFSDTQENLIKHIQQDGQRIVDFFNTLEKKRIVNNIMQTTSTKGLTDLVEKDFKFSIHLPIGYKIADQSNEFIWFRKIEPEVDKDVFVAWKTYEAEYQLLPDSLIAWRDAIAEKYLFEDPENPSSYLVTEREVPFNPVIAKQVNLNNHFAMELRGLWRTNNRTMGGPFISCALVDEARGLLYYIEGFTYSPGKSQREIIRELEAVLWTFKTSNELPKIKDAKNK